MWIVLLPLFQLIWLNSNSGGIKMRVLHIIGQKKGFKVNAAVLSQIESLEKIIDTDVFVYKASSIVNYLYSLFRLHRQIRSRNYDLIHAHFSRSAFLALLVCNKLSVIVSYMGTDLLGKNWLNFFIKKITVKKAAYQIVKSKAMLKYLPKSDLISVIPNGVCFNRFRPIDQTVARKQLNLDNDKIYILFPANPLRKEKNYALAKNAVDIVKEKTVKEIELLSLFDEPHDRVCLFMNACDIVLLTSVFEGSPNVIKEAIACNCRIVSTNVGDVSEHIDGVDGCFLAMSDPDDMSRKIMKCFTTSEKTNGRDMIKGLDISLVAEQIVEIYYSIIKDMVNT